MTPLLCPLCHTAPRVLPDTVACQNRACALYQTWIPHVAWAALAGRLQDALRLGDNMLHRNDFESAWDGRAGLEPHAAWQAWRRRCP